MKSEKGYDQNDYYLQIADPSIDFDILKDEVSSVFDIVDVLQDYLDVSDIHGNGRSLRCPCPIHQGSNPDAMLIDTERNICHSFTENRSYNILELVNIAEQRDIKKVKDPLFSLCNTYGVNPTIFTMVKAKEAIKDDITKIPEKEDVKDNKSGNEVVPDINLSKEMMRLMELKRNPFLHRIVNVKSGRKTISRIGTEVDELIPYSLTKKQAGAIIYEGLRRFTRNANILSQNGEAFVRMVLHDFGHKIPKESFNSFLNKILLEYKDIAAQCKAIGFERLPENYNAGITRFFFAEKSPLTPRDTALKVPLSCPCTEMDAKDVPQYPEIEDAENIIEKWDSDDVLRYNDRCYCPTLDDYYNYNLSRVYSRREKLINFEKDLRLIEPFCQNNADHYGDYMYFKTLINVEGQKLDSVADSIMQAINDKESVLEDEPDMEVI